MASELRVNTLKDASGNNSIATSFVAGGSAKAWGHFEGSDATLDDSFNTSSLTDNGTGDFSANFTNSMDSANYAYAGAADVTANSASNGGCFPHDPAASNLDIETASGGNLADRNNTVYIVQGDLA